MTKCIDNETNYLGSCHQHESFRLINEPAIKILICHPLQINLIQKPVIRVRGVQFLSEFSDIAEK
jgi:hypothetical protein